MPELQKDSGLACPVNFVELLESDSISFASLRSMAGMGFFLPMMGSWFMYYLACVELKHELQPLVRSISDVVSVSSDSDSDEEIWDFG